ncbi:MAG: potassium uptake system protein [Desulfitibacter sp. BRH_c19]|nr:MAG: potassium uptake system protein [Desulfitibacter sp. BRH_c19]
MSKGNFAVIGLGRFGSSVARTLINLGHDVLGIDKDEKKVEELSNILTHVIVADSKKEEVLQKIGIRNFDTVIVAIGHDLEANILTTVLLSQFGIKNIIAKASSDIHGDVLLRVGATKVVFPERDMGEKIGKGICSGNFLDFIDISPEYSVVEVIAPKRFLNKSLGSLNLRPKYEISVLAIKKRDRILVAPGANDIVEDGDLLVVIGENNKLSTCFEI